MNARIPSHTVAAAMRQRATDLDARAADARAQSAIAAQGLGPQSSYRTRTLDADSHTRRSQDLASAAYWLRTHAEQVESEGDMDLAGRAEAALPQGEADYA